MYRRFLLGFCAFLVTPLQADEGWISLFDGKSLDGWTPKIRGHALGEDPMGTFQVRNGVIAVDYSKYDKFSDRFGHLFYKLPYSKYRMKLEYRFLGEKQIEGGPGWAWKNSGVMVHGQKPESMGKDQEFPVSAEIQLLGGGPDGERTTGNLCTPGTNVEMDGKLVTQHCTNSKSKTYRGEEWVTLEIDVQGSGLVTHKINGEEVMRYSKVQYDPNDGDGKKLIPTDGKLLIEGGSISLQSESHAVEFRNIVLRPY